MNISLLFGIVYFAILSILLLQWLQWLAQRYKELRFIDVQKKPLYYGGALLITVLSLAVGLGFVYLAPDSDNAPAYASIILVTILFWGFSFIPCLRAFLMNSSHVFRGTLQAAAIFTLCLAAVALFSFMLLRQTV